MKSLRTSSGDVGQLTFLILILLLFEVLTGQDGQGSSNKEPFAGAVGRQCPCWPGLEGPLEWRHYWADGSRPYLKYQKYARGSIIRINMMENK